MAEGHMLMAAGANASVTGSIFGPTVNALLALGLFVAMLVAVRSRRPRLGRKAPMSPSAAPHAVPADPSSSGPVAAADAALGDAQSPVCGESPTGR